MPSVIRGSDNFDSGQLLGKAQTWQDMTASRAAGVNYTNNTGEPIAVRARLSAGAAACSGVFLVDGVTVDYFGTSGANADNPSIGDIVPPGGVYRINVSNMSIVSWSELRP